MGVLLLFIPSLILDFKALVVHQDVNWEQIKLNDPTPLYECERAMRDGHYK